MAKCFEAQGNLAGALKSYEDSLAIAGRLAKADPSNTHWQEGLSVIYIALGDVLLAQGDLAEAAKSYQDSLATAEAPGLKRIPAMPTGNAVSSPTSTGSATSFGCKAILPVR